MSKEVSLGEIPESNLYKVKTAALLYLRAKNSGRLFDLMCDVKGTGHFDDIILTVQSPSTSGGRVTYLFSVQYRGTSEVVGKMPDSEMEKYFSSFIQISNVSAYFKDEKPIQNFHFVVLTNVDANPDAGFASLKDSSIEDLLRFDLKGGSRLRCVTFSDWLSTEKNKEQRDEFLRKFALVTGFREGAEMDNLLAREVMKALKVSPKRAREVTASFIEVVKHWVGSDKGQEGLDQGSDLLHKAAMDLEDKDDDKRTLKFEFKDSSLLPLQGWFSSEASLLHVVMKDDMTPFTDVIVVKLLAALREAGHLYSLPGDHERWGLSNSHLVITEPVDLRLLDLALLEVEEDPRKQLVLLTGSDSECAVALDFNQRLGNRYTRVPVGFSLNELSDNQLDKLLEHTVKLQGKEVTKRDLFTSKITEVKSPQLMAFILKDNPHGIGLELIHPPDYYIQRKLQRFNSLQKMDSCSSSKDAGVGKETEGPGRRLKDGSVPKTIFDIEERQVVITGEVGLGKSTLLAYVASKTKENDAAHWIVHISLRNHFAEFHTEDFDPFKVLVRLACGEGQSEEEILKYILENTSNISVLFDDFGKVSEKCKTNFKKLCSYLLETTKVRKVWLCTSTSRVDTLTGPEFSRYKIERLTQDQQKLLKAITDKSPEEDLLQRFTKDLTSPEFSRYKSETLTEDQQKLLKAITDKSPEEVDLLQCFNKTFNDNTLDFTSIPRHLKMCADILKDKNKDRVKTRTLAISILFKNLTTKLFQEVYKENTDIEKDEGGLIERLTNQHKAAAVVHFLGTEQIFKDKFLAKHFQEFEKALKDGKEMVGLVSFKDGKPCFIHVVYAQYFFSIWLAENYKEQKGYITKHYNNPEAQTVRIFFDQQLCQGCEIHVAVLHGKPEKVETYLEDGDVNGTDRGGRTPLHLASAFNYDESKLENRLKIVQLLLRYGADITAKDEIFDCSPVSYAVMVEGYDVLNELLSWEGASRIDLKELGNIIAKRDAWEKIVEQGYVHITQYMLTKWSNGQLEEKKNLDKIVSFFPFQCARVGNGDIMKCLIANGVDLKKQNRSLRTPLHVASEFGRRNIVELILEEISTGDPEGVKEYLEVKDDRGFTPFLCAAKGGSSELMERLFQAGSNLGVRTLRSSTTLTLAADQGNVDVMEYMLKIYKDKDWGELVNAKNKSGNSALYMASRRGSPEAVTFLIKHGANLHEKNNLEFTVLHAAAYSGNLQVVNIILKQIQENDKDNDQAVPSFVKSRGKRGELALHIAAKEGNTDVMEILLKHDPDILESDALQQTCFHYAAETGQVSTLEFIAGKLSTSKLKEAVQRQDEHKNTAMHVATVNGQLELLKKLLEMGGDINSRGNQGQTLLHIVAEMGYPDLVEFLLERVEDVNAWDDTGRTPLDYVVLTKDEELINMFLAKGAEFHDG